MKLIVINGPNLNMLGLREPGIYGSQTYLQLCDYIKEEGVRLNHLIDFFQSNSEGQLIDCIHKAYYEKYNGLIINPAAYTHYSYAIYDALKGCPIPAVEVHLSDIHKREPFRQVSVTAAACIEQIYGKGAQGYLEAIKALEEYYKARNHQLDYNIQNHSG